MPLKHLSNFWKSLNMPLINCEINLILTWSENYILTSKATRDANPDADPEVAGINNCNISNDKHKILCSSCHFIN